MSGDTDRITRQDRHARSSDWRGACIALAAVSGALAAVMFALLVANDFAIESMDLTTAIERQKAAEGLQGRSNDAEAAERVRGLDLATRKEAAARRRLAGRAKVVLLISLCIFVIAVGGAVASRRDIVLPEPESRRPEAVRENMLGRWAAAVGGSIAVGAVLAGVLLVRPWEEPPQPGAPNASAVPRRSPGELKPGRAGKPPEPVPSAARAEPYPPPEWREMARNWFRFRGPGGGGLSPHDDAPTVWDATKPKGVLWTSPIPMDGQSSPVVWDDRVFVTGATKAARALYCYDLSDGRLLWTCPVSTEAGEESEPPDVFSDDVYAASTPATDGRRVFALFANGDLASIDYQGRVAWAKNLGRPDRQFGYASSPTLFEGVLIVLYDHIRDMPAVLAYKTGTGELAWSIDREGVAGEHWTSPIIARTPNGPQLVCAGNPWVVAYDPRREGKEIWRADRLGGPEQTPSPIYAGGLVITAYSGAVGSAIPTDKRGDISQQFAWEVEDGLPDYTSPVSDGRRVYFQDLSGLITCYDLKSGRRLWEHPLPNDGYPSPSIAAGRLYCVDDKGVTYVLKLNGDGKPETLASNPLGEAARGSPAFVPGRIILRGEKRLFCVGKRPE